MKCHNFLPGVGYRYTDFYYADGNAEVKRMVTLRYFCYVDGNDDGADALADHNLTVDD